MTYYKLIKTLVVVILLYQLIALIDHLGFVLSVLPYTENTLLSVGGAITGLLFIAASFSLIYFCITKVDSILHFFRIDTLFVQNNRTFDIKVDTKLISTSFIILGFYTIIPSLATVLIDSFRLIQNDLINNSRFESRVIQESIHPDLFLENVIKIVMGILLVSQSKYLGSWISSTILKVGTDK